MAERRAAGAPVPAEAVRQAPPASPAQWTYRGTGTDVHTMATKKHFHTTEAVKEQVVASNHPCPWSQFSKEPKISHGGLHMVAAAPSPSKYRHGKTRDLDNQWHVHEQQHTDDGGTEHDTRGPIGHGAKDVRKPVHVRRHIAQTYAMPDGRVIVYPDHHHGEPGKSVSWADARRSSPGKRTTKQERLFARTAAEREVTMRSHLELEWGPNSTAIGHVNPHRVHDEHKSQLRDKEHARREVGWVDHLSGRAGDGRRHGANRNARDAASWEDKEDDESEAVAPPMERPRASHPLVDLLVATWFGSPAAAEANADVPLIATDAATLQPEPETAVQRPWRSEDSDDDTDDRHDYPKPWQANMSPHRKPTTHQHTFARPAPKTPPRSSAAGSNPLAHLQSDMSPELSRALQGTSGKGVPSGGGGAKLKLRSPPRDQRAVQQPDSPWKWAVEREREARQKSLERRASSPGGTPVRGGAV